jgi:hypothetical protein
LHNRHAADSKHPSHAQGWQQKRSELFAKLLNGNMKTVFHIFVGFIVYAIGGVVEPSLVMMALLNGDRYAIYLIYMVGPFSGLFCGLVGIAVVFLVQRRAYNLAAWVSIVAFLSVAVVTAALFHP